MKKTSIAVAVALMVVQVNAHAFEAIASVVSVSPITEQVNRPTQQCWTDSQQVTQVVPEQRSPAGAIIGGVVGGLLGATIGRGNGRVAAAAVGAGCGCNYGECRCQSGRRVHRDFDRARAALPAGEQLRGGHHGYQVIFEYAGQRFSTRLPYNPRQPAAVNVSVTPR